jgi:hypothetical protein
MIYVGSGGTLYSCNIILLCKIKDLLYYRPNCACATGSFQNNRMDIVNERVSRELRSWVIAQPVVVISYRRFWTDKLSRNVGKISPLLAS